jgi:hypothetical protein
MASHDRSDVTARDVEVGRAAVLPLRARRTTGEAEEHWVPDVDRLRGAVGFGSQRRLAAVPRVIGQIARRSVPQTRRDRLGAFGRPFRDDQLNRRLG